MWQLKKAVGISFTLFLVMGSQFFGMHEYCLRYLSINIQYFAECAPAVNRAVQQRPTATSTIKPITTTTHSPTPPPRTPQTNCLENANVDNSDPRQAIGKHPVSRLFEIQAKNHGTQPTFKDIGQRGQQNTNNVEFHVQVTVNDRNASAWGRTKKEAKRRAAIEMLTQMGLKIEADNSNTINPC